MASKKKKLKNQYQILKEKKRNELIQIGAWLPLQKFKPSKKLYSRKNKKELY